MLVDRHLHLAGGKKILSRNENSNCKILFAEMIGDKHCMIEESFNKIRSLVIAQSSIQSKNLQKRRPTHSQMLTILRDINFFSSSTYD